MSYLSCGCPRDVPLLIIPACGDVGSRKPEPGTFPGNSGRNDTELLVSCRLMSPSTGCHAHLQGCHVSLVEDRAGVMGLPLLLSGFRQPLSLPQLFLGLWPARVGLVSAAAAGWIVTHWDPELQTPAPNLPTGRASLPEPVRPSSAMGELYQTHLEHLLTCILRPPHDNCLIHQERRHLRSLFARDGHQFSS